MRHRIHWLLLFLFLTGCGGDLAEEERQQTINISALPDQAPAAVLQQHAQLLEYICRTANIACRWIESADYETLVDLFGKGEIDLAYFGGVTFALAHERYGAIPLVMRDIDIRFTSSLYVHESNNTIKAIKDLQGKTFSFGPFYSTSGHIMPRYYLRKMGIEPEHFFNLVTYSQGHDDTLIRLDIGEIEAGFANSHIANDVLQNKKLSLKQIWETPPYVDYIWAVHPSMNALLQVRLQNAFLALDITSPADKIILEKQGARGYLPALIDDFIDVNNAVKQFFSLKNIDQPNR